MEDKFNSGLWAFLEKWRLLVGTIGSTLSIAVAYLAIAGALDLPPFDNGSASDGGATLMVEAPTAARMPTRPPVTPLSPGELPDLVAVKIDSCDWHPSSEEAALPELGLILLIAGEPDFARDVPVEVTINGRLVDQSIEIDEQDWSFEEDRMRFETYTSVDVELMAEDLGKGHDVIVHIAPNADFIPEGDKSNNETSVRLVIPEGPLPTDYEGLSRCTSPIP